MTLRAVGGLLEVEVRVGAWGGEEPGHLAGVLEDDAARKPVAADVTDV